MQQYFLPVFLSLKSKQPPATHGLWLVHSDEPLTQQWLIDALRPHWQANEQTVKRLELISPKSWQEIIGELGSVGLFDEGTALIVTGKHKPDSNAINALTRLATDIQRGELNHHLLWCSPKQDKKSLTSKAVKLFDNHGVFIDANVHNEQVRTNLLKAKADELKLHLTDEAWQLLLVHTEHNLLGAFWTLWRLSYLPATNQIDTSTLASSLSEGSQFDVFGLSDSLLAGDVHKSLTILSHLKHTGVAPSLVLWAINKDARLISQLQAGKDAHSLGIWQNKIHAYRHAAWRSTHSQQWAQKIYTIDKTIKGIAEGDVWQQLQALVIAICGTAQNTNT